MRLREIFTESADILVSPMVVKDPSLTVLIKYLLRTRLISHLSEIDQYKSVLPNSLIKGTTGWAYFVNKLRFIACTTDGEISENKNPTGLYDEETLFPIIGKLEDVYSIRSPLSPRIHLKRYTFKNATSKGHNSYNIKEDLMYHKVYDSVLHQILSMGDQIGADWVDDIDALLNNKEMRDRLALSISDNMVESLVNTGHTADSDEERFLMKIKIESPTTFYKAMAREIRKKIYSMIGNEL